jgi:predicted transglutaminase-like cysteine proteinase
MLRSMLVAAAVAGGAAFLAAPTVQAAPAGPMSMPAAGQSLVDKVQYNYCRRWYRECRARWGGGRDFRRCMRRRGC